MQILQGYYNNNQVRGAKSADSRVIAPVTSIGVNAGPFCWVLEKAPALLLSPAIIIHYYCSLFLLLSECFLQVSAFVVRQHRVDRKREGARAVVLFRLAPSKSSWPPSTIASACSFFSRRHPSLSTLNSPQSHQTQSIAVTLPSLRVSLRLRPALLSFCCQRQLHQHKSSPPFAHPTPVI